MKILKLVIAILLFQSSDTFAASNQLKGLLFPIAPIQIVILPILSAKSCGEATSDGASVPPGVCRIDVNVSVTSGKCSVVVEGEIHAVKHRKIEWVIKQAGTSATLKVEFADFESIPPILFRDASSFAVPPKRKGPRRYVAFPTKKGGSYYYIFLQWKDSAVDNNLHYCEVIDPIINNDEDIDDN